MWEYACVRVCECNGRTWTYLMMEVCLLLNWMLVIMMIVEACSKYSDALQACSSIHAGLFSLIMQQFPLYRPVPDKPTYFIQKVVTITELTIVTVPTRICYVFVDCYSLPAVAFHSALQSCLIDSQNTSTSMWTCFFPANSTNGNFISCSVKFESLGAIYCFVALILISTVLIV